LATTIFRTLSRVKDVEKDMMTWQLYDHIVSVILRFGDWFWSVFKRTQWMRDREGYGRIRAE
jgi:hypothetical protein